ncbi:c-type cytochrome [Litoribrevibacter albus]|uniref:Cytochrome c domain-containing protein n=1 Tax=Litoribrevibacter albus TaxID=1473156 RepID=A0AA37SCQ2_9GAMM|nr:cytochrome c [Litoribrevibacter albus]GLQ32270.1 hypothetical protein GCM10007876_27490 [Litoribrevibacter albus]
MKSFLIFFFSGVFISMLLSGCSKPDDEMNGKELYESYCAKCHKSSGKGNFLLGVPDNRGTNLSYWEIKVMITRGSENHKKMRKFKHLTDTQAGLIAAYVMSLKKSGKSGAAK